MEGQNEYLLFSMGNPLLDVSVQLKDNALFEKYGLQLGMACLAEEKHAPLFDELWASEGMETIPGGSALNSTRACNFMAKSSGKKVLYFGCIGEDEKGTVMKKALDDAGVSNNFSVTKEHKTGACGVLVKDQERTLVADLAAALKYPLSHLEENLAVIDKADMVYIASFFMTSNYDAMKLAIETAVGKGKVYGFNLSATFLVQGFKDQQLFCIKNADYVFGNEDEADCFAEAHGLEKDRKAVARFIAKQEKTNQERKRVAIITQQAEPVIVCTWDPKTGEEDL